MRGQELNPDAARSTANEIDAEGMGIGVIVANLGSGEARRTCAECAKGTPRFARDHRLRTT